jgi:hypothetical protein
MVVRRTAQRNGCSISLGVTDGAPLTSISLYRDQDTAISLVRLTFRATNTCTTTSRLRPWEGLIPEVKRMGEQAEIDFDFVLTIADAQAGDGVVHRQRVAAAE